MIRLEKGGVRWELAPDFASILDPLLQSSGQAVKGSRVKEVTRHSAAGRVFYIKRYLHSKVTLRPLKFALVPSQAAQEWRVARVLEKRGVPIVRHVALGERWAASGVQESILITEEFPGVPLNEATNLDPAAALKFVERLHDAGVLHEDLHPANVLVRRDPLELRLVDLHGIRLKSKLTADERERNLALLRVAYPIPVTPRVQRLSDSLRQQMLYLRSKRCLLRNSEFERRQIGPLEWQVRRPFVTPALEKILEDPDGFLKSRAHILKPGRTSTVGRADGVVMKRYNFRKLLNLAKDLSRASRARRSYRKAYHLELLGIPTARSIAVADRRAGGFLLRSYFVMEEIAGATDLGAYLRSRGEPELGVIRQAASLVGKLHREGFHHMDLKETNLVFDQKGVLHLIDLDGLHFLRQVPPRRVVLALTRLQRGVEKCPNITRRHRFLFLLNYCRARGLRTLRRWEDRK